MAVGSIFSNSSVFSTPGLQGGSVQPTGAPNGVGRGKQAEQEQRVAQPSVQEELEAQATQERRQERFLTPDPTEEQRRQALGAGQTRGAFVDIRV
ncbi:hypothetical protein HHL28_17660 [Aerophototrophica crusticola]|uniref:Uncharacterized protein n=1 Tax=Aerophototrophica crusticola TaxID=1709002 RepID=A0A858RB69_9PROT|nr:hypothetical protein HHL28_17660 [Rhodospirillaceae bacterium B3]